MASAIWSESGHMGVLFWENADRLEKPGKAPRNFLTWKKLPIRPSPASTARSIFGSMFRTLNT